MKPELRWIELQNLPVFEQLELEEELLRSDEGNYCIVNRGSPRAIVMGISGVPNILLDLEKVRAEKIPVIKRCSGGGTVVVDENTLFVTFILNKRHVDVPAFPEPILRWSADLYTDSWQIPGFHLRENDYCIGNVKCGGNAQYIKKDRWLHHTSFLWDYEVKNMECLLLPPKRPKYRENRNHNDFLCKLKEYSESPENAFRQLKDALVKRFYIQPFEPKSRPVKSYRKSVHLVEI